VVCDVLSFGETTTQKNDHILVRADLRRGHFFYQAKSSETMRNEANQSYDKRNILINALAKAKFKEVLDALVTTFPENGNYVTVSSWFYYLNNSSNTGIIYANEKAIALNQITQAIHNYIMDITPDDYNRIKIEDFRI
jgi:hypothetical protein